MTEQPPTEPREIIGCGTRWRVFEINAAERSWAHRERTLIFISATATRRIYDYPANWAQLSDAELYALSWRA